MSCTPCQRNRISELIATLKTLNAVEHFDDKENKDVLYIKTFLINDKRNRNGWRATWNSIKKNAKTFIGRPGIEFLNCGKYGCMLDHTSGHSYDQNVHTQEKYRVSTITDVVFDEATHTAYAVHEITNKEFAEKIKTGEIKYLSPAIWPNREKTTVNISDNAEWHIDTTDWVGMHAAFVDMPAYGHRARVISNCTMGKACIRALKRDKQLVAREILYTARMFSKYFR